MTRYCICPIFTLPHQFSFLKRSLHAGHLSVARPHDFCLHSEWRALTGGLRGWETDHFFSLLALNLKVVHTHYALQRLYFLATLKMVLYSTDLKLSYSECAIHFLLVSRLTDSKLNKLRLSITPSNGLPWWLRW